MYQRRQAEPLVRRRCRSFGEEERNKNHEPGAPLLAHMFNLPKQYSNHPPLRGDRRFGVSSISLTAITRLLFVPCATLTIVGGLVQCMVVARPVRKAMVMVSSSVMPVPTSSTSFTYIGDNGSSARSAAASGYRWTKKRYNTGTIDALGRHRFKHC